MKLIKWAIAGGLLAVCLSSTAVFAADDCTELAGVCYDLCRADELRCYEYDSGNCGFEFEDCAWRCAAEEKRCQILRKSEEDPCDRTTPEEN